MRVTHISQPCTEVRSFVHLSALYCIILHVNIIIYMAFNTIDIFSTIVQMFSGEPHMAHIDSPSLFLSLSLSFSLSLSCSLAIFLFQLCQCICWNIAMPRSHRTHKLFIFLPFWHIHDFRVAEKPARLARS